MSNYNGALSAAQLIATFDNVGAILENCYLTLGLGIAGESGTTSALAATAKTVIVGDGTSGNPGLGNVYAPTVSPSLDAASGNVRWDALFSRIGGDFVRKAETQIQNTIPSGWLLTNTTNVHYLNNHLLRMNAAHTGVPTTPGSPVTLAQAAGGSLPTFVIGNCPYIVFTIVGVNEYDESLPCPVSTQIALTGGNSALLFTPPGTVPAGATYIKIYRSYVGGANTALYYDQRVAVTVGGAYPPVTCTQADSALKTDWTPPAWLSCLFKPAAACIVALSLSVTGGGASFLSLIPGAPLPGVPLTLSAVNMLTPQNVAFGPANGFLGLGNNYATQGAIFGTTVVGTGFTAGTLQSANSASAGLQGFTGTTALRARVTSVLNAAGNASINYSYYNAANGYGVTQTATALNSGSFSGTAVGSIATFTIPAGRLVVAVTADAPSGIASGTYVIESAAIR